MSYNHDLQQVEGTARYFPGQMNSLCTGGTANGFCFCRGEKPTMCADFARQGAKKQPSPKPQEESEPQPAHTQTGSIVSLQRLVGNQGVQHLVSEGRIQRHRSGADLPPLPGVARHRSAEREQDAEEQEGENEEAPVTILGVQAVSATSPSDKGKILIATSAPVEHLQRAPKGAVGGGIS